MDLIPVMNVIEGISLKVIEGHRKSVGRRRSEKRMS